MRIKGDFSESFKSEHVSRRFLAFGVIKMTWKYYFTCMCNIHRKIWQFA